MLVHAIAVALAASVAAAQVPATPQNPLQLTAEDVVRLRAYHDRVVEAARELRGWGHLKDVLGPALALAARRSATGDPAEENRAALLAVAFLTVGRGLPLIVPEAVDWPAVPPRRILLQNRHDLAQHFMVSAAVAAWSGEPLANALGLYKEMDDARRGSGFSFADLAADRAGTTFGRLATESADRSRALQAAIAALEHSDRLMPSVASLPEGLSARQFAATYGNRDTPAWRAMVDDIEQRIAALPFFSGFQRF